MIENSVPKAVKPTAPRDSAPPNEDDEEEPGSKGSRLRTPGTDKYCKRRMRGRDIVGEGGGGVKDVLKKIHN